MAEYYDIFSLIKPLDNLASENGLTSPCRSFKDKSLVLTDDHRKIVDDLLLPISKTH